MKKCLIPIYALAFILLACSTEKQKLEVFNPEAFAYSLEDGWELNASTRVKGFIQKEDKDGYSVKLSYYVNIITPAADTLNEADYGIIDERKSEEIADLGLDVQIELDSSFMPGKYKIIFFVSDDYSNQQASTETEFDLSAE